MAMPVLWLVFLVVACRWFTRRPVAVIAVPVVAAVVWFALLLGLGAAA